MGAEATPSPANTPPHLISFSASCCRERRVSDDADRRQLQPEQEDFKSWEMETVVGDLMATELRLGLPGTIDEMKAAAPSAPSTPRGKKRTTSDAVEDAAAEEAGKRDVEAAPPAAK